MNTSRIYIIMMVYVVVVFGISIPAPGRPRCIHPSVSLRATNRIDTTGYHVGNLMFSPDGRFLFFTRTPQVHLAPSTHKLPFDAEIMAYDLRSGRVIYSTKLGFPFASRIKCSVTGRHWILLHSDQQKIVIFDSESGRECMQVSVSQSNVFLSAVAYDDISGKIYASTTESDIYCWNYNGECLGRLPQSDNLTDSVVYGIDLDSDRMNILCTASDGVILLPLKSNGPVIIHGERGLHRLFGISGDSHTICGLWPAPFAKSNKASCMPLWSRPDCLLQSQTIGDHLDARSKVHCEPLLQIDIPPELEKWSDYSDVVISSHGEYCIFSSLNNPDALWVLDVNMKCYFACNIPRSFRSHVAADYGSTLAASQTDSSFFAVKSRHRSEIVVLRLCSM